MAFNNHKAKRREAEADARGHEMGRRLAKILNARTRLLTQRLSRWQRASPRNKRLVVGLLMTFFILYLIYLIITILSYYGTAAATHQ